MCLFCVSADSKVATRKGGACSCGWRCASGRQTTKSSGCGRRERRQRREEVSRRREGREVVGNMELRCSEGRRSKDGGQRVRNNEAAEQMRWTQDQDNGRRGGFGCRFAGDVKENGQTER